MSYFGEDFLQGFFGADGLRDYQHASKAFRTNGYGLMPRYKFLFWVYFNLNSSQIPQLNQIFGNQGTLGLMVKTAQLPNYNLKVATMNQYNRKRLVQSKVEYLPVQMTLHDDQDDVIRTLWYTYFSYYYKDPTEPYNNVSNTNGTMGKLNAFSNGMSYNTRDTYSNTYQSGDWGYVGESASGASVMTADGVGKPPFFRDITIYGFSQKKFAAWTLINPMITSWNHDIYDYSAGDQTMQNSVTIDYETVKYYTGAIGGSHPSGAVPGFSDPSYYDTTASPIARPGLTSTVFGQGGLIDAGAGFIEDLQAGTLSGLIGAVQTAGATYNTFKNKNLGQIAGADIQNNLPGIIQSSLPGTVRQVIGSGSTNGNGMIFPTSVGGAGNAVKIF
jgi:hypothetical protein